MSDNAGSSICTPSQFESKVSSEDTNREQALVPCGHVSDEDMERVRKTRTREKAAELLIRLFGLTQSYEAGDTLLRVDMPVKSGDILCRPTKAGPFFYLCLSDSRDSLVMTDVLYPIKTPE